MNKPVCIDVGANFGQELEEFLKAGYTVYAFEPVPRAVEHLKTHFKGYEGFRPVPLAVDIENRWVQFKENPTVACSSMYEFTPDIMRSWDEGGGVVRNDFVTVDRYPVMTTRLDTFMNTYNVGHVDYLWVDAQGNDFNVLLSLGERVKDIEKGQVEAAMNLNLYTGPDNSVNSIALWLRQNGFEVKIVPHHHKNEADIFFERPF